MTELFREAIVDEQVQSYVARDIDRFCALYAPDATAQELPSGRWAAQRNDVFRTVWTQTFAKGSRTFERLRSIVQGRFDTDHELLDDLARARSFDAVVTYPVGATTTQRVGFLVEDAA